MFVQMEGNQRKCSMCGELKPPEDFAWRLKAKGRRDSFCRPCRVVYSRKYYLANKQRYAARTAKAKRRIALERTRYLLDYFKSHPCADCGATDPIVLEFDHVDPSTKAFNIGTKLATHAWASVLAEIDKCEVVCANCHRRRHRGDGLRATAMRLG